MGIYIRPRIKRLVAEKRRRRVSAGSNEGQQGAARVPCSAEHPRCSRGRTLGEIFNTSRFNSCQDSSPERRLPSTHSNLELCLASSPNPETICDLKINYCCFLSSNILL